MNQIFSLILIALLRPTESILDLDLGSLLDVDLKLSLLGIPIRAKIGGSPDEEAESGAGLLGNLPLGGLGGLGALGNPLGGLTNGGLPVGLPGGLPQVNLPGFPASEITKGAGLPGLPGLSGGAGLIPGVPGGIGDVAGGLNGGLPGQPGQPGLPGLPGGGGLPGGALLPGGGQLPGGANLPGVGGGKVRNGANQLPNGYGGGRGGGTVVTKPSQVTNAARQQINNAGLAGNRGTGGGYGFGNSQRGKSNVGQTWATRFKGGNANNQIPPGKNINRAVKTVQQMQQRTSAGGNVPGVSKIGPPVQLNNNNRPVERLPNIGLGHSSARSQVVPERRGNLARVVSGILLAEEKTARKVASPPTRKSPSKAEGKPKSKNGRRQKTAPGADNNKQPPTAHRAAPNN